MSPATASPRSEATRRSPPAGRTRRSPRSARPAKPGDGMPGAAWPRLPRSSPPGSRRRRFGWRHAQNQRTSLASVPWNSATKPPTRPSTQARRYTRAPTTSPPSAPACSSTASRRRSRSPSVRRSRSARARGPRSIASRTAHGGAGAAACRSAAPVVPRPSSRTCCPKRRWRPDRTQVGRLSKGRCR